MTITVSGTERRTATPTFTHLLGLGFVRGLHPDAVSFGPELRMLQWTVCAIQPDGRKGEGRRGWGGEGGSDMTVADIVLYRSIFGP